MDWTNADVNEIAEALAAAQGEFEPAVKKLTARIKSDKADYVYTYADLAEVIGAVMAALSKNGIAVIQPAETLQSMNPQDRTCVVEVQTVLLHKSGQVIAFKPFRLRSINDSPQAVGSTLTYARRYSLQTALGIAPEADDDGRAGQGDQPGGAGDRRPYDGPSNRQSRRQPAPQQRSGAQQQQQQPQPQQRPAARQQQQAARPTEQFEHFRSYVRTVQKEHPDLFPDSKTVWEVMRPVCERLGVDSGNIQQIADIDVFTQITEPVQEVIRERQESRRRESREAATVEGSV